MASTASCRGHDKPRAALEEVAAWQARPLDPAYPLVFFEVALGIEVIVNAGMD